MTLNELVEAATETGISLGRNPARTVRYYVARDLMPRPQINYRGKVKEAVYSSDHLAILKLIDTYKKEGYKLEAIKGKLKEPIYWSDEALEFLASIIAKNNYPSEAFQKDKPVTREAAAVFFVHFFEVASKGGVEINLLWRAFVDKSGAPALSETLAPKISRGKR